MLLQLAETIVVIHAANLVQRHAPSGPACCADYPKDMVASKIIQQKHHVAEDRQTVC